ncbi:TPA: hypothetical protein JD336_17480 [Serratia marcescens]|nr:hypothetical protein [Serratia marcescens]
MNQFHSSLDLYHRNKGRRATVPETPFLLLAKRIPPMYWCCGQLKLATALEFFQYRFSDSFGGNPPLYSCGLSAL